MFDHEKLKVYQKALYFIEWLSKLEIKNASKKIAVIDNLDRASTSIVLNIPEGNGKFTSKDRCRFFDISRGSALESAGCLDVLLKKGMISKDDNEEGKRILEEIVSMLVGLIKSNSDRVFEEAAEYGGEKSD